MHQLRYHSGPAAAPLNSTTPPVRAAVPVTPAPRKGRSGAIAPLALAIVVLLSGGAFAATRPRPVGPTRAELKSAIHRAAFTQADFPAGWTAEPTDAADPKKTKQDGDTDDFDRVWAECTGKSGDGGTEDVPYEAESNFSSGDQMSVSSSFWIESSLEEAQAGLAALRDPEVAGCLERAFRALIEKDKSVGGSFDVNLTPAHVPASLAGKAAGFRISVTIRANKVSVPVDLHLLLVQQGRIGAALAFSSVGEPFPTDLKNSLTTAVVTRLAV